MSVLFGKHCCCSGSMELPKVNVATTDSLKLVPLDEDYKPLTNAEDAKAKEELAAERKVKTLEAEVIQLAEDLVSSEKAHQAAENQRDELAEQINAKTNKDSLMVDEKRRLEARITTIEEELEEEQSNSEALLYRNRMEQFLIIEQLSTELATEKSNSQNNENVRALLERQNKELKAKLAEIETAPSTKGKATIAGQESKTTNTHVL